jgi:hypothetical protein
MFGGGHPHDSMGFSVPGMDGSLLGQPLHYPQHQVGAGIPGGVTLFPGQPAVVEAVSTPLVPTGGMPSDIAQLLVKGRSHWLKGNELVKLLQHGMEGNFPLSAAAADLPPSGTLFMYDRKQVRFFRLDGHNWRKKHDGKTVRETHEKLKAAFPHRYQIYTSCDFHRPACTIPFPPPTISLPITHFILAWPLLRLAVVPYLLFLNFNLHRFVDRWTMWMR